MKNNSDVTIELDTVFMYGDDSVMFERESDRTQVISHRLVWLMRNSRNVFIKC